MMSDIAPVGSEYLMRGSMDQTLLFSLSKRQRKIYDFMDAQARKEGLAFDIWLKSIIDDGRIYSFINKWKTSYRIFYIISEALGLHLLNPPTEADSIFYERRSEISELLKKARAGDDLAIVSLAEFGIKYTRV